MSLLHCNFTTESASETILKVCKYIWGSYGQEFSFLFFLTHDVVPVVNICQRCCSMNASLLICQSVNTLILF